MRPAHVTAFSISIVHPQRAGVKRRFVPARGTAKRPPACGRGALEEGSLATAASASAVSRHETALDVTLIDDLHVLRNRYAVMTTDNFNRVNDLVLLRIIEVLIDLHRIKHHRIEFALTMLMMAIGHRLVPP